MEKNAKKNIVIFSLLLSLKISKENKRNKKKMSFCTKVYLIFDSQSCIIIFFYIFIIL